MSTEDYLNTDYGQTFFDFDDKPAIVPDPGVAEALQGLKNAMAKPAQSNEVKFVTPLNNGSIRRVYMDGTIEILNGLGRVVTPRHKPGGAFEALKKSQAKLQAAIKENDAQIAKTKKQMITYVDQDGNETTVEEEIDLDTDGVVHEKVQPVSEMFHPNFVKPKLAVFPHDDPKMLHAPGRCDRCDGYADLQAIRRIWGIEFTGDRPQDTNAIVMDNPDPLYVQLILPDPYDARQELINRKLRKARVAQNVAALNEIEERHV